MCGHTCQVSTRHKRAGHIMERRKFIIGAGALGAGLSTAIGTGAFTSVEAERSFDVSTAGDANAALAISAAASSNGSNYVSTNGDGTVAITLPDVNNDAVTTVEDLLTIQNQGSQTVNVYVRDDSSAVQFVTTDGDVNEDVEGPGAGASLANTAEVETGESVNLGLVVDTLNNDVSNNEQLIDTATIVATADSSVAGPAGSSFDRVVDPTGSGDGPAEFLTLEDAVLAAVPGDTIAVRNDVSVESPLSVDVSGITLTSTGSGRSRVAYNGGYPDMGAGPQEPFAFTGDDITVDGVNFQFNFPGTSGRNSLKWEGGQGAPFGVEGARFTARNAKFSLNGPYNGGSLALGVIRGRGTEAGPDRVEFDNVTLSGLGPGSFNFFSGAPLFDGDGDREFVVKNSTVQDGVILGATGVAEGQSAVFNNNTFTEHSGGENILFNQFNGELQASGNSFEFTVDEGDNRKFKIIGSPTSINGTSLAGRNTTEAAELIASANTQTASVGGTTDAAVQYISGTETVYVGGTNQ